MVRRKMTIDYDYEVVGREYEVKGEAAGIVNMICDSHGKELALLSAKEGRKNSFVLGDSSVQLKEDVLNNQEILLISLCVVLSNFQLK